MMQVLILLLHVAAAIAVCGLVLLQHGKGADMGAAFGGGASGSLFGASGSANFLSRSTAVLATVFFLTSLGLTWYAARKPETGSVMDAHKVEQPATPAAPAGDVPQPAAPPDAEPPDSTPGGDSKAQEIPK
ncbi:MAG TPA: preprotein translocase subunit SecG [Burkholderiales bacterium]|nr:preprotein translocase subunit SecG [Burkholderiales bacterium]